MLKYIMHYYVRANVCPFSEIFGHQGAVFSYPVFNTCTEAIENLRARINNSPRVLIGYIEVVCALIVCISVKIREDAMHVHNVLTAVSLAEACIVVTDKGDLQGGKGIEVSSPLIGCFAHRAVIHSVHSSYPARTLIAQYV